MNVLVYLLPLALSLGALGLVGFVWSLRTRQFEDLQGAGWRAIADDDLPDRKSEGHER
ncbi:MAG: cbb3-type cytochrome oxidase assembly protein CcoS [Bosea sp. (in: a-proteobacteria)]